MWRQNPYSILYVVLVLIVGVAVEFVPSSNVAVASATVNDPAKMALDMMGEMSKLTLALNSAMFAAAGALAIKGKDWSARWSPFDSVCIVLALISGAVSYYAVYVGYVDLLGMVYAGAMDPFERHLTFAVQAQYFGTLVGVFFVGLVFTGMLAQRK